MSKSLLCFEELIFFYEAQKWVLSEVFSVFMQFCSRKYENFCFFFEWLWICLLMYVIRVLVHRAAMFPFVLRSSRYQLGCGCPAQVSFLRTSAAQDMLMGIQQLYHFFVRFFLRLSAVFCRLHSRSFCLDYQITSLRVVIFDHERWEQVKFDTSSVSPSGSH